MPLSRLVSAEIQTIEILSTAGQFVYTFRIPQNSVAQLLWVNLTYAADATVGTRRVNLDLSDANGNTVYAVRYFKTQAAGTLLLVSFLQGSTVIPSTILGLNTTIPFDGLYAGADYVLTIDDIFGVSAGDSMTGFMQTRGLHNSGAQ